MSSTAKYSVCSSLLGVIYIICDTVHAGPDPTGRCGSAQVQLEAKSLKQTLTVVNKGKDTLSFTAALHSYFRVADVTKVSSDPEHPNAAIIRSSATYYTSRLLLLNRVWMHALGLTAVERLHGCHFLLSIAVICQVVPDSIITGWWPCLPPMTAPSRCLYN